MRSEGGAGDPHWCAVPDAPPRSLTLHNCGALLSAQPAGMTCGQRFSPQSLKWPVKYMGNDTGRPRPTERGRVHASALAALSLQGLCPGRGTAA